MYVKHGPMSVILVGCARVVRNCVWHMCCLRLPQNGPQDLARGRSTQHGFKRNGAGRGRHENSPLRQRRGLPGPCSAAEPHRFPPRHCNTDEGGLSVLPRCAVPLHRLVISPPPTTESKLKCTHGALSWSSSLSHMVKFVSSSVGSTAA